MSKIIFAIVVTSGILVSATLFGQAFRFNGNSAVIEDLDPNDGVDFVEEFAGSWTLKFAAPFDPGPPISNSQVDGGSRTVYAGVNLVDLAFETSSGTIDLVNSVFEGEYIFWDRADFNQHIVELNFLVGNSTVNIILSADSTDGDFAFGNLFDVNTPDPNLGLLNPQLFVTELESETIYSQPQLLVNADPLEFGAAGSIVGDPDLLGIEVLLGDVNRDDHVNLLDVAPFVALLTNGQYQAEADING